ncbi:MAG: sigma-70 family RNA polymerase sigma factor [Bryobacterales bacterium]|nr:sigma-70 family RNA polymerase sigma factor [Bryobacterales bacterium]
MSAFPFPPELYLELRNVAASLMRREAAGHTLQPTALVHEVILRLMKQENLQWNDRGQVLGLASMVMRRLLVDHARGKEAKRRRARVALQTNFPDSRVQGTVDVLAVNEALDRMAQLDARAAKVVEMRFFGGFTYEEIAQSLNVSTRAAKRDWEFAQAFLLRELGEAKVP